MRILAVIPARWAATRYPGKPLADLNGKPMVQWVWEATARAEGVDEVVVATEDQRIADAVAGFGGVAVMTSPDHLTGTDRLAEVARARPADVIINVQGDEPMMQPQSISALAAAMRADASIRVGTLCTPMSGEEAKDPNRVKVVRAGNGDSLYFSRSPIPYPRNADAADYWLHLGIYGYRADVLAQFASLPQPDIERAESLEQLRILSAGIPIRAIEVAERSFGVDTPQDMEVMRRRLAGVEERAPAIRLVLTDVDGVMTDGGLFYGPGGEETKRFDVRDGLGLVRLRQAGIKVAALTGRHCAALERRLQDLGVDTLEHCTGAKGAVAEEVQRRFGVTPEETAAIGDDLPDLELFARARLRFAPADAVADVKAAATTVLDAGGGRGAFRELSDRLLADLPQA